MLRIVFPPLSRRPAPARRRSSRRRRSAARRTRAGRLAVLAGAHEDSVQAGVERPADVALDVVADHRRLPGLRRDRREDRREEAARRLADDERVGAGGILERRDERPHVERQPVGRHPVAVALQRDQLGSVDQLPERPVQHRVAERIAEVADDHRVDVALRLLHAGEVLLDVVAHEQHRAPVPLRTAAIHGERRRRAQLVGPDLEPQPVQALEDRVPRARGRVGHEPQREPALAQLGDRLAGAGHGLVLHVEHAVEVEQQRPRLDHDRRTLTETRCTALFA